MKQTLLSTRCMKNKRECNGYTAHYTCNSVAAGGCFPYGRAWHAFLDQYSPDDFRCGSRHDSCSLGYRQKEGKVVVKAQGAKAYTVYGMRYAVQGKRQVSRSQGEGTLQTQSLALSPESVYDLWYEAQEVQSKS